jgi:DNA (cytosine-5)-methyltransferase 1
MLRHLDLFSGIGGFALAARMVGGYETVAFCEIEPYCQAVLRKHWPGVPVHGDVRTFPGVPCDVLTGGFPCQDVSLAGKGAGIEGARSGLWKELCRLIGVCRPRGALIENSPALRTRGYDRIKGELGEIGYACEPFVVAAADVGADHLRKRAWLVAYPFGLQLREQPWRRGGPGGGHPVFARHDGKTWPASDIDDAGRSEQRRPVSVSTELAVAERDGGRAIEPCLVRGLHGIPGRVDRIRALGNAIVPQVAAIFLQAIKESVT